MALHVARQLRHRLPDDVELVELDDRSGAMLSELPGREALLVVDAVRCPDGANSVPRTIIDVDYRDPARRCLEIEPFLSSHGWSVASELELGHRLDWLPPIVRIVGMVVADVTPHRELGQSVQEALPMLVERVMDRLDEIRSRSTPAGDR